MGGIYWRALIMLLAGVALWEFLSIMRHKGQRPLTLSAYILAYMLLLGAGWEQDPTSILLAGFLIMVVAMLIEYPGCTPDDLALSFLGAFYCGFTFSFALLLNMGGTAAAYLLMALLLTWGSDIGGYLFGRIWGRNKLAPTLSPAKTWEGAAGSVILSVTVAILYVELFPLLGMNWWQALLVGSTASLAAQIGDLWESSLKRYAGVKDSGSLLPGHGGVLDRFDSFMLVIPVMYYIRLLWL